MTYNVGSHRKDGEMASSPVTNIRIDPDLKEQANAIFEELGLTLSTAVNVFLRAVVREGGMPFDMKLARTGDSAMETNRDIAIPQHEKGKRLWQENNSPRAV
jgi:DNA-damage-inducible protein J